MIFEQKRSDRTYCLTLTINNVRRTKHDSPSTTVTAIRAALSASSKLSLVVVVLWKPTNWRPVSFFIVLANVTYVFQLDNILK